MHCDIWVNNLRFKPTPYIKPQILSRGLTRYQPTGQTKPNTPIKNKSLLSGQPCDIACRILKENHNGKRKRRTADPSVNIGELQACAVTDLFHALSDLTQPFILQCSDSGDFYQKERAPFSTCKHSTLCVRDT